MRMESDRGGVPLWEGVPPSPTQASTQTSSSIHVTRYADDFVVTAKRKEDLKEHVLGAGEPRPGHPLLSNTWLKGNWNLDEIRRE